MSVNTWRKKRQTYSEMLGIKPRNSGAMMGYISVHSERQMRGLVERVENCMTGSGSTVGWTPAGFIGPLTARVRIPVRVTMSFDSLTYCVRYRTDCTSQFSSRLPPERPSDRRSNTATQRRVVDAKLARPPGAGRA